MRFEMRLRHLIGVTLVGLVFVLGVVAGGMRSRLSTGRKGAAAAEDDPADGQQTGRMSLTDEMSLRADVRRVVRDEVQRALRATPFAAAAGPPVVNAAVPPIEELPPAPTPQNIQALATANSLIDAAKARGAWTDDDAQSLHRLVMQMATDKRQQVMNRLSLAINRDELKVRVTGPPF